MGSGIGSELTTRYEPLLQLVTSLVVFICQPSPIHKLLHGLMFSFLERVSCTDETTLGFGLNSNANGPLLELRAHRLDASIGKLLKPS